MPVALNGNIIEVTSDQADLSGLIGIAGVTSYFRGRQQIVDIGLLELELSAKLYIPANEWALTNSRATTLNRVIIMQDGGVLEVVGTGANNMPRNYGWGVLLYGYSNGFGETIKHVGGEGTSSELIIENSTIIATLSSDAVTANKHAGYSGANNADGSARMKLKTRGDYAYLAISNEVDLTEGGNSRTIFNGSDAFDLQATKTYFDVSLFNVSTSTATANSNLTGLTPMSYARLQVSPKTFDFGSSTNQEEFLTVFEDFDNTYQNNKNVLLRGASYTEFVNPSTSNFWTQMLGSSSFNPAYTAIHSVSKIIDFSVTDLSANNLQDVNVIIQPDISKNPALATYYPNNSTTAFELPTIYEHLTDLSGQAQIKYVFMYRLQDPTDNSLIDEQRLCEVATIGTEKERVYVRKYGFAIQDKLVNLVGNGNEKASFGLSEVSTVLSELDVQALTGISFDFVNKVLTVTEGLSAQDVFDKYQYELTRSDKVIYSDDFNIIGDLLDVNDWDANFSESYEGSISTTGTVTGVERVSGNVSDINSDLVSLSYSGAEPFSRLIVFNFSAITSSDWTASIPHGLDDYINPSTDPDIVDLLFFECTTAGTTGATRPDFNVLEGETVADGTVIWTARSVVIINDTFDVNGNFNQKVVYKKDITALTEVYYVNGLTAKNKFENFSTLRNTGLSISVSQSDNQAYIDGNVDGSNVPECSVDPSGRIQIDIDDSDNNTSVQRIRNWFEYQSFLGTKETLFPSVTGDVANPDFTGSITIENLDLVNTLFIVGGIMRSFNRSGERLPITDPFGGHIEWQPESVFVGKADVKTEINNARDLIIHRVESVKE